MMSIDTKRNLLKSKRLVNGRSDKAIIYYKEGTKSVDVTEKCAH